MVKRKSFLLLGSAFLMNPEQLSVFNDKGISRIWRTSHNSNDTIRVTLTGCSLCRQAARKRTLAVRGCLVLPLIYRPPALHPKSSWAKTYCTDSLWRFFGVPIHTPPEKWLCKSLSRLFKRAVLRNFVIIVCGSIAYTRIFVVWNWMGFHFGRMLKLRAQEGELHLLSVFYAAFFFFRSFASFTVTFPVTADTYLLRVRQT